MCTESVANTGVFPTESDDFDSATTKVIISKRPAFPTDVVVAHNVSTDTTSIDPFADRYTVTSTGASPEDVVYTLTIESKPRTLYHVCPWPCEMLHCPCELNLRKRCKTYEAVYKVCHAIFYFLDPHPLPRFVTLAGTPPRLRSF